ncbi:hypothetical protein ACU686_36145 [Yinghuangia aomiensis]
MCSPLGYATDADMPNSSTSAASSRSAARAAGTPVSAERPNAINAGPGVNVRSTGSRITHPARTRAANTA